LDAVGAKVTKSQVVLDRPIKSIGVHEVKVALHPEVAVTVKVNVARSPEEADLQAQGIDVLQQMFEDEAAPLAAEDLAPVAESDDTEAAAPNTAEAEPPAAEEGEQPEG
ncbi:MAG: 50S ribosomal L9 C-terminal domain-containing protein, partial [Sphingomicrobium sp.]